MKTSKNFMTKTTLATNQAKVVMNAGKASENTNSNAGPIRLGFTAESRDRIVAALLVFQRWLNFREDDGVLAAIPPGLVEGLCAYLFEPDLLNLHLDHSFHLSKPRRRAPSSTVQIFEFVASSNEGDSDGNDSYGGQDETRHSKQNKTFLSVRCVRKFDNDVHTLNVQNGQVHSVIRHWALVGTSNKTSTYNELPPPSSLPVVDAPTLLRDHWVAPRRWLLEGRAVIVRPSDMPRALKWIRRSRSPPANDGIPDEMFCFCKTAIGGEVPVTGNGVFYLRQGFTLLLVVGDLVRVALPGREHPFLLAGMMFREGEPQQRRTITNEEEDGAQRRQQQEASSPPVRPDGLAFIIAADESQSGFKGNTDDDYWRSRFLQGIMYSWTSKDVFEYIPGPWL